MKKRVRRLLKLTDDIEEDEGIEMLEQKPIKPMRQNKPIEPALTGGSISLTKKNVPTFKKKNDIHVNANNIRLIH